MKKMKILIAQNTDWLKRNPAQQHHLAEMLSLRGHEIKAIDYEVLWRTQGKKEIFSKREIFSNAPKIHEGAKVTVIRPGIIKIPVFDYLSWTFTLKRELARQIKDFAPDIIISLGIAAYFAGKAARKNNLPFIFYWIDVSHRLIPSRLFQPIGWLIERKAVKLPDYILVINDKLKNYVIKQGASPGITRVLRAGIDVKKFNPSNNSSMFRKRYGLKREDITLFFMGWLYNFSGLKEVALQLAKNENSKLKFLIVGEGDAYEELLKIREKYNLQNKMILTGKKPYQEIPELISAADICLLPAYTDEKIMQEIVPIKIYEYMAMVKPVISTNLPGVRREFGEDNGVVYVERPEDVVPKAIELVESGRLAELGQKARRFVEQNSWEKITDEFESLLEGAIEEKKEGRKESAGDT